VPEGSLEYNLSSVHWLDAMTAPLEGNIRRLADAVLALLQAGRQNAGFAARPAPGKCRTMSEKGATQRIQVQGAERF